MNRICLYRTRHNTERHRTTLTLKAKSAEHMDDWDEFLGLLLVDGNQKSLPFNSGPNVSSMTWFTIAKSRW
jgi:hypothetical protein